ncbi:hypothetical protein SUGI_0351890 [Cryptomeria japonica]|uniref:uncharacterized protein LOC131037056 n=1 Tax=Cryptomeria japonica TaxID=3369 RepID=UPI002408B09B|nr:uncharacterized protein LOC131037056 [Cryptomeria japonica]XP_057825077.2 uncharacterized protein LOC131037056 [Cryptomeria japonica]XP_057825078.2 uncharacterized protein LOC131037056 [Cryptomeria japonica]XP_059075561.1 uncharacterized protein LOC131037056 [Cryptomeria japonica]XP_059075562.1 uncharacterized protein LOC131037056 [Cryptomeria japonica]GLJ19483.1 hypothetical protein SUGI_0351890 [Cryptomeria japonica]
MYPQGGFRNPYSIHGIGDRSQTGRQPSRTSIPISQPEPQPRPQSQQQQVPKPEAKKEEPPKPTQPARQFSKPEPQVPKQYQQKDSTTEPKRESPIPPPATATVKQPPPPPPATDAVKQPPPPPPQAVNLSLSESKKAEELSIVPVDQGKAIVKGSNPEPEKSLQQGIKEDITSLTCRLAELHAQHKLLNADQKQKGQAEMGVGVITLAGENRGATMDLGPDSRRIDSFGFQGQGQKVGQDEKNEEKQDAKSKGNRHSSKASPVHAFVNSNVQAANNSILYNSTCPHRDPGVRLSLSNNPAHAKEIKSKESHPKATKNPAA